MMAPMAAPDPWFVVVNPASGGGRARRRWAVLQAALQRLQLPYRVAFTESPGHATSLAKAAVAAGERRLLSVGGDGTFHEVVNGLYDGPAPPPDGVIALAAPGGTGNDWAKWMGVPADLDRLAAAMARGRTRRVDLGLATCRAPDGEATLAVVFHNNAGAGIDAAVLSKTPRRGPRALAYLAGLLRTVGGYLPPAFTIRAGGRELDGRRLLVMAAIGPHCGGGMRLAPAADPADGLLDLVAIDPMPLPRMLRLLPALFNGRLAGDAAVHTLRCSEAVVDAVPSSAVEADGQIVGRTPLILRLLPQALLTLDCG